MNSVILTTNCKFWGFKQNQTDGTPTLTCQFIIVDYFVRDSALEKLVILLDFESSITKYLVTLAILIF